MCFIYIAQGEMLPLRIFTTLRCVTLDDLMVPVLSPLCTLFDIHYFTNVLYILRKRVDLADMRFWIGFKKFSRLQILNLSAFFELVNNFSIWPNRKQYLESEWLNSKLAFDEKFCGPRFCTKVTCRNHNLCHNSWHNSLFLE